MGYSKQLGEFIEQFDSSEILKSDFHEMQVEDKVAVQLIRSLMSFYNLLPNSFVPEENALWFLASAITIRSTREWCKNGVDDQEEEIVALLLRYADSMDSKKKRIWHGIR